jgi:outer membrane scaffolding protein for murein synthesis (MipA/OmpV family)
MMTGTALAVPILAGATQAQETEEAGGRWSVGAIGFVSPSPFAGEDTELQAFPFVSYQGDRFYLRGLEAGYHVVKPARGPGLHPSFSVLASARSQPGTSRDKFNGELGLRAGLSGTFGSISLTALQDVTGVHDGQELELSYSYRFAGDGGWALMPSVGISWQSEGLAQHMWGVTAEEQADMIADGDDVILPVYDVPGSAFTYNAGLMATYDFNDRWGAMLMANARYLDSDIRDNPGIDRDVDLSFGLGISYRF